MPRDDLDEFLAAVALPPRARARWLDDLERFCRAHGGERHYRELMALVRECKQR
ncbi:MAG TPA: hypothetical protein VGO00_10245 [Kofleriaceae bacterium]|nr:hypothetical protein [Kofleriaceae bacterium]